MASYKDLSTRTYTLAGGGSVTPTTEWPVGLVAQLGPSLVAAERRYDEATTFLGVYAPRDGRRLLRRCVVCVSGRHFGQNLVWEQSYFTFVPYALWYNANVEPIAYNDSHNLLATKTPWLDDRTALLCEVSADVARKLAYAVEGGEVRVLPLTRAVIDHLGCLGRMYTYPRQMCSDPEPDNIDYGAMLFDSLLSMELHLVAVTCQQPKRTSDTGEVVWIRGCEHAVYYKHKWYDVTTTGLKLRNEWTSLPQPYFDKLIKRDENYKARMNKLVKAHIRACDTNDNDRYDFPAVHDKRGRINRNEVEGRLKDLATHHNRLVSAKLCLQGDPARHLR